MAKKNLRLPENVDGDFYVDSSCIDCGTCRWMAPDVFRWEGGHSVVHAQPQSAHLIQRSLDALVACPSASIGAGRERDIKTARDRFPIALDGKVHHCGFHSEDSFGAASWLIRRDAGNVMVDSPRFNKVLAKKIEGLGGIDTLFLTHRDDVADHARWAEHFGAQRVMHKDDITRGTADVEIQVEGSDPVELAEDLQVLPVPGHTRGSACLLFGDAHLFTGDHLAFRSGTLTLRAFDGACWFSWKEQIASMERLFAWVFEERRAGLRWVIPGHGAPGQLDPQAMQAELARCIVTMKSPRPRKW
jgi:glyoxylase-like metal-dependent hydrolase (beta-lactamase superfamily II)/ferredoxin